MRLVVFLFLILFVLAIGSGCSSRGKNPIVTDDSTIIYLSKERNDSSLEIYFYRNKHDLTNPFIRMNSTFAQKNENLKAVVDLGTRRDAGGKDEYHLVWVGPEGKSIYTKKVVLVENDTVGMLKSAISISPEKRSKGKYKLKVYNFRELIAEKFFYLTEEFKPTIKEAKNIDAQIQLGGKSAHKSQGGKNTFIMKKKRRVKAKLTLGNRFAFDKNELELTILWLDSNADTIYKKDIALYPNDTTSIFKSSISIDPEKRLAGDHKVQLLLQNHLVAEEFFVLKKEFKPSKTEARQIGASITLYRKKSKKTGKLIGEGSEFTMKNKRKLRVDVNLTNPYRFGKRVLKFKVDWRDSDNKSFYKKSYSLIPSKEKKSLYSSISISPEKRKPGKYSFSLYLYGHLIASKSFILKRE